MLFSGAAFFGGCTSDTLRFHKRGATVHRTTMNTRPPDSTRNPTTFSCFTACFKAAADTPTPVQRRHALLEAASGESIAAGTDRQQFRTTTDQEVSRTAIRNALRNGVTVLGPGFDLTDYFAPRERLDCQHIKPKKQAYESVMGLLLKLGRAFSESTGSTLLQAWTEVRDAINLLPCDDDRTAAFKGIATVYIQQIIRAEEAKEALLEKVSALDAAEKSDLVQLARPHTGQGPVTDRQIVDHLFRLVIDPQDLRACDQGASPLLGNAEYSYDIAEPGYLAGTLRGLDRLFGKLPARMDAGFVEQLHDLLVGGAMRSAPSAVAVPFEPGLRDGNIYSFGVQRGRNLTDAGAAELAQLDRKFSFLEELTRDKDHLMAARVWALPVSKQELSARLQSLMDTYHASIEQCSSLPMAAREGAQSLAIAILCSSIERLHPFKDGNARTVNLLHYMLERQCGHALSAIDPNHFDGHSAQEMAATLQRNKIAR